MINRRFVKTAAAVAVGGVALGWSGQAIAETTGTDLLAQEIPVAPADENAETSAAVSRIIELCAEAYKNTDVMKANGSYIYVNKYEKDGETTYSTAKISVNYLRPDKLAIVCESEDAELDCAFYADGTTATHVSAEEESYVTLPQPDTLAAYAENYRRGEIYQEYSGALALSVTVPILISENPYKWLHEDVERYIYEGREQINGNWCHRIRFIQVSPQMIVIIWVNEKTWLIDKVSFINSYDEDYNMLESFEEGDVASMSVLTWDSKSTDAEKISRKSFKAVVPKDYEHVADEEGTDVDFADSGSWWDAMVGLAAETSPEETTWSLARRSGNLTVKIEQFATVPQNTVTIAAFENDMAPRTAVVAASKEGEIVQVFADGRKSTPLLLNREVASFSAMLSETSQPVFLVTDKSEQNFSAYDDSGKELWKYHHPYASISTFRAAQYPDSGVFVSLSADNGVRKLGPDGEVLFASTKLDYVSYIHAAPGNADRVIMRASDLDVMDRNLKYIDGFDSDEWIGAPHWDVEKPEAPIVGLAVTNGSDVMLQQRSLNGDIAWTTMIKTKAEDVNALSFEWARLPVNGEVQRCILVLLSDGTVSIVSEKGESLYRGQVSANPALVKQNNDSVLVDMVRADLDQDGIDEVYTRMGERLMQLTVEE